MTEYTSAELIAQVNENIAPNTTGAISPSILAAQLIAFIQSYPNIADGGSLSTSLGTVIEGVWEATPIGLPYGGFGSAMVPSDGGILYSTGSGGAVLAGTATSNQMLMSGDLSAPSWSTATWPSTLAASSILWSNGVNNVVGLATADNGVLATNSSGVPSITQQPTLGVSGTGGEITLKGSASGSCVLGVAAAAGSVTFTFPATNGANGSLLSSNGSGATAWSTATYPLTATINQLLWSSAANVISGLVTADGGILATSASGVPSITNAPTLGVLNTTRGVLTLCDSTSGSTVIGAASAGSAGAIFNFPPDEGPGPNCILQGDGSGNSSWVTAGTVIANASVIPSPQGRLTNSSGTPVLTANVSSASSVFYTPYIGNNIPLWNGTTFVSTAISELSNILSNSATGKAGPLAAIANSLYDLFVWADPSNSNTPTLTRGPLWTNASTRNLALARVNGILTNQNAITNGPGAEAGTYVGTILTDGSAFVSWTRGGAGSTGVAATLTIWNMYNRVEIAGVSTDTGSSYTYTTATIRQAHASVNNQITLVAGLIEDDIRATLSAECKTAAALSAACQVGIGLGTTATTTSFTSPRGIITSVAAVADTASMIATLVSLPTLGVNILTSNENGDGANANTFNNNSTNTLAATIRM